MGFAVAAVFLIGIAAGWFVRKEVDASLVEMHETAAMVAKQELEDYLSAQEGSNTQAET